MFPIAGYTSAVASQSSGSGLVPSPRITADCFLQERSSSVHTPLQVHWDLRVEELQNIGEQERRHWLPTVRAEEQEIVESGREGKVGQVLKTYSRRGYGLARRSSRATRRTRTETTFLLDIWH